MTFEPDPTQSGHVALGVAFVCGLTPFILLTQVAEQDSLWNIFILFMGALFSLGGMFLALAWAVVAFRLRYTISRNGVVIDWRFARQVIPFEAIERVVPSGVSGVAFRGVNLAGLRIGWGESIVYPSVRFFSTTRPQNSLLIVTPTQTFVISPQDADGFLRAWERRLPLEPTQQWSLARLSNWPFTRSLLLDYRAWGMVAFGLMICLGLLGYLTFFFADLPRTLPLLLSEGSRSSESDKVLLFLFPLVGVVFWGMNTLFGGVVYSQDRLAAYLAWGSNLVVQLTLWGVVYTIIGQFV